jgi:hypothetical protein
MDNDLETMTKEDLVAEVKNLRQGIRNTVKVRGMICVGTTLTYGDC